METLRWEDGTLYLLDQTVLPFTETYLTCTTWQDVHKAISVLAVRGAPAIGVAAAYGVVLGARTLCENPGEKPFLTALEEICVQLDGARPTAVNLHWALEQMMVWAKALGDESPTAITGLLEEKAKAIHADDVAINTAMAGWGADEIGKGDSPLTLLTHCNAGALATAGVGTALGVISELHRRGRVKMVYADETRPLLQGARLTAFELMAGGVPVTLITDNMAAWTMKEKGVDAIIVGADRIAANGDTANKIGTYGLSLMAKALDIPLYIAAPLSTFDRSISGGSQIPIEERNHDEVRSFRGTATALSDTPVFNPAFDVTPHENIRAIITEKGIISHPDTEAVQTFFDKHSL